LLGARRWVKRLLSIIFHSKYLHLNGEDIDDANLLKERSVNNYSRLLANIKVLVIDEAQNIPTLLILKLIVDSIDGIKLSPQDRVF
jgi:hypothetical protein